MTSVRVDTMQQGHKTGFYFYDPEPLGTGFWFALADIVTESGSWYSGSDTNSEQDKQWH